MTRQGKGSNLPSAIRLIRMMQLIPRHSEGSRGRIGAARLHELLEEEGFPVSLRTVQRNLEELQQVFPGLKNDGNRDMLGWYWAEPAELMDIPAMDAPLALAFKLAERYLSPVAPGVNDVLEPYLEAAGKVLDERARDWLERIAIVPRSMPLIPAPVDAETARKVQIALLERRRLRLRYRPRTGDPAEYELSPQGLVIRHEVSYLVATAWDYTDPRHYALHRMEPGTLELLDTPATELEDFDLQQYIDQGAFQYRCSEKPLHLVVRLKP
ncbi:MAG: WYL domain-containing transcriptional regulator, partial [Gammaproteobacteria bacterium]